MVLGRNLDDWMWADSVYPDGSMSQLAGLMLALFGQLERTCAHVCPSRFRSPALLGFPLAGRSFDLGEFGLCRGQKNELDSTLSLSGSASLGANGRYALKPAGVWPTPESRTL